MTNQLDVGKVMFGAFVVPWINRARLTKALAVPSVLLVASLVSTPYWQGEANSLNWVMFALCALLLCVFSVICHRLFLDQPDEPGLLAPFRVSRREAKFLLWLLLVTVLQSVMTYLWAICMLLVTVPFGRVSEAFWTNWLIPIGQVFAIYFVARLCFVFPATALDKPVTLAWSWRSTKNNGWRLALLVGALPWAMTQTMNLLLVTDTGMIGSIAVALLGIGTLPVVIAAVSLAYRQLVFSK